MKGGFQKGGWEKTEFCSLIIIKNIMMKNGTAGFHELIIIYNSNAPGLVADELI